MQAVHGIHEFMKDMRAIHDTPCHSRHDIFMLHHLTSSSSCHEVQPRHVHYTHFMSLMSTPFMTLHAMMLVTRMDCSRAHSKDFFDRKTTASTKDIELNTEAQSSSLSGCELLNLPEQACYAVMKVTPKRRLSEEVLAQSIKLFYEREGRLPVGVSIEALEGQCARMAYGLKKIVVRFRPLYHESPQSAKSKNIQGLKRRLLEREKEGENSHDAPPVDAEDLE